MRTRNLFFLLFLVVFGALPLQASIDLAGRWVSTKIVRKEENSIGAGWTVTFRADGTFTEEIDEGFGIVEVWSGKYELQGVRLSMHREGFSTAWDFSVTRKKSGLVIASKSGEKDRYVVCFRRSDAEHPELVKLPRWPKSKSEAVEILKQKMNKHELEEFARTPKDNLIGKYHFYLGMYIRNAFGIWRGNKDLWEDLTHGKRTHPDNLSGIILEALWEDLQKKEPDQQPEP